MQFSRDVAGAPSRLRCVSEGSLAIMRRRDTRIGPSPAPAHPFRRPTQLRETMSLQNDTWTPAHDLALVYIALAYGTDHDLTDAPVNDRRPVRDRRSAGGRRGDRPPAPRAGGAATGGRRKRRKPTFGQRTV